MPHRCNTAIQDIKVIGVVFENKWVYPNCMELSPIRHWSVERHIRRKHIGIGEPVNINIHQTRTQMNTGSGWSNFSTIVNPTQFNCKTNSIQLDNGHQYYNNYLNNDNNTSEPTQTYPKNNNTFLLLQIILTTKKQEEDSFLYILKKVV